MNYLPRKVIKEEVNKINSEFDFDITLSHNRFNIFEDKSYVIKIKYKKFRDTYGLIIPIRRDVIRQMNRRNLRKILNYELSEINKKFSSYGGRKEIKRRSIEADREWARYIPDDIYDKIWKIHSDTRNNINSIITELVEKGLGK